MLWEYNLWVFATKDVMVQNYRNWHWVAIDFLAKELIIADSSSPLMQQQNGKPFLVPYRNKIP